MATASAVQEDSPEGALSGRSIPSVDSRGTASSLRQAEEGESCAKQDDLLPQQQDNHIHTTTTPSHTERYYVYGDGNDSAEAYSSISVTSALVFGFAVTTYVTVEAGHSFPQQQGGARTRHVLFGILMALTISLSAFGFTVMNLQYYQVRRMRVVRPDHLRPFLKGTFWFRHVARGTTWIALALYLLGLLVYTTIIWHDDIVVAIGIGLVLGVGALSVIAVWCALNHRYMLASGKKKKRGIGTERTSDEKGA